MGDRSIVWTVPARRDLENIRTYVAQFKPLAAQGLAHRLVEAVEALAHYPTRGRLLSDAPSDANRRELVIVWPYLIRYRVEPERIIILRIRHGALRPDR